MSKVNRFVMLPLAVLMAACTVQDTPAPPLTGPSELALRIAMQAIPDSILQDGASQTSIIIDASGPDGRPVRGQAIRLEIIEGGIVYDFGLLSAKTVVTGDDGRARATYTAPPRPLEPVEEFTRVTIRATPIGNDARDDFPRTVDIRLVTPGFIRPPEPPNNAPVASFTVSPAQPTILQTVTFDASGTTDEGAACGACTYRWDFGDGTTGTGIFATHQYQTPNTYQVRLTVTDPRGGSAVAARSIDVGAGTAPTASFTYSPTAPAISQPISFNAQASRAAPGRRIVSYDWDFGTNRFASGVIVTKQYDTPGTYVVTLTVTDDAGSVGTVSQSVTVGGAGTGPIASLTVSPGTGTTATNFFFDATPSTGPSPIVFYRFDYGDGRDEEGTLSRRTHRYVNPGTYTARVTVRDAAGRTATATTVVNVQ